MAFKKEGLLCPCQLKAPRVAVVFFFWFFFWVEANFLQDKTITRRLSTRYSRKFTFSEQL